MKVTIRQVAKAAGVSLGTASRVLNGLPNVTPGIRKRVEKAIARLDYKPDPVAQAMRKGASRTVGVLVRDITVPALAAFVRAAQDTLHEAGYALVVAWAEERKDRELDFLASVASRRVDGLILNTSSERDPELVQARKALGIPMILLDREVPRSLDAMLIAHDQGVRHALEYLYRLGHRRIAIVTGSTAVYPGRSRLRGYEEFFAAHGQQIDRSLVRTQGFGGDSAFVETSALLSLPKPPTAIVLGGISMLAGALRAVRARGLRIPEDLSLVGSGDSELAALATPPVSVIRWNYAELGRTGAKLLLDRLRGETHAPRRIVVPTEFVMRESCAPPRV